MTYINTITFLSDIIHVLHTLFIHLYRNVNSTLFAVWFNTTGITMVTMQQFSFQAPQQPKKAMKKITTPIAMITTGAAEADTSWMIKVL